MKDPMYKVGDLVKVVDTTCSKNHYSYFLDGAVGYVDQVEPQWDSVWIYHLKDYIKLGDRDIEENDEHHSAIAWFMENCLEPYCLHEDVDEEDFANVFR